MFTFNKDLKLTSVSQNFIETNSLPSNTALKGTSVITMLAYIASPATKVDYDNIMDVQLKLQALRVTDEVTYQLTINKKLYKASFRAISNNEYIGLLEYEESSNRFRQMTKKVGDELTSLILVAKSPIEISDERVVANPAADDLEADTLPRILVVDDSEVNRDVVKIFLAPDFPQPLHARNGVEALNILAQEHIDLILMDIHMPDMNGIETTLAIRNAKSPWSDAVIIALTSDTAYQHSRIYKNIGMNDSIIKPIRQDVLIKTVLRNWNAVKLNREAQSKRLLCAS